MGWTMFENVHFGSAAADYQYETGGNKSYTVQSGDTLFKIAQKFYGNGYLYNYLAEINGISNPDRINVGDVLIIPPNPTSKPSVTYPGKPTSSTTVSPSGPLPTRFDLTKIFLYGAVAVAAVLIILSMKAKKESKGSSEGSPQEA